jgi:type IV secretory pathway VirB6-like protein
MPPNSTNDLFEFLSELLTTHSDTFQALGLNLFRGFALILIVWFGIKSALSSASGGPGFHFDHFAQLILTIAFGFAMITYYSQPLPAIGVSFHKLITDEGLVLANRLNNGLIDEIFTRLNSIYFSLEVPVITFDIIAILHYVLIIIMILLLEAAVFFVIAFGYIAAAIAVLLGPIFVPFFIVPKMEWLFWGWFKAFVQYSFYPVVANAYLFIFGNMVIHLADSHPPPYDGPTIALLFAPLMFLLIGFVYGVVRIPSLVGSLFSGSSGESVIPKIL